MIKNLSSKVIFLLFWLTAFQAITPGARPQVPELVGPVNDYAGLLTSGQARELQALMLKREQKTSNQVVILTVTRLKAETIEELALNFFNAHGLGKKKIDSGVLIAISKEDRKVRIEVGYGHEGRLTDAACSRIISEIITPNFKKQNYFTGLKLTVTKIYGLIDGKETFIPKDVEQLPWSIFLIAILFIILLFCLYRLINGFYSDVSEPMGFFASLGILYLASGLLDLKLAPIVNGFYNFASIFGFLGFFIFGICLKRKSSVYNSRSHSGGGWSSDSKYSGGGGRSGGGGSSSGW